MPGTVALFLFGAGAVLSLAYLLRFSWAPFGWPRTLVKTGAVALPALGLGMTGWPVIALAGLWACALGDFLLSRPGEKMLLAGIASFALGHILYVVGFFMLPGGMEFGSIGVIVLLWLLAMFGASTEFWLAPHTGTLRMPVRVYIGLILLMGITAAGVSGDYPLILVGALLFIASDLVLSLEIFVFDETRERRFGAFFIWLAYYGAQVFLMLGFAPEGALALG